MTLVCIDAMNQRQEKKSRNAAAFSRALLHPRYWLGWLVYLFFRILFLLPYTWLFAAFSCLGYAAGPLFKKRYSIVKRNAQLCFPEFSEEEQEKFIRDVLANTIIGFFETLYGWWGSAKWIKAHSRVEGIELLEQARENDQGVVLISGHFSSLDLSGRAMLMHLPLSASYRKHKNALMNYIINGSRNRHFENLVEKREMRRMLRLLRKNEIIWYATDQDFGRKDSVFAPFFGIQTCTLTTLSRLTSMTKAKPLHYSYRREGRGKNTQYVIRIYDAYSEGFSEDEVANATLLNKVMEDNVRQSPEQYLFVHRRFKTRPNVNDANLYE